MVKTFLATDIKVQQQNDYLIVFADNSATLSEHVTIHMAREFSERDIELGEDGEYFEYGCEDDIGAQYKCVKQVVLALNDITFILNPCVKVNISEIKIIIPNPPLDTSILECLKIIFSDRLITI